MFKHYNENNEKSKMLNDAMSGGALRIANDILEVYDLNKYNLISEIGGDQGALLTKILKEYPEKKGIVFDQRTTLET